MYTLSPEPFVLSSLILPTPQQATRRSFKAGVFRGHLERTGSAKILDDVTVTLQRVIHAHEFVVKNVKLTQLEYVPPHQYKILSLWANGDLADDWTGHPPPREPAITPEGLTDAALEPCIGAPLYPGIEASWKLRDEYEFSEAFRLNSNKLRAGGITKQMSLPGQSDFLACAAEAGENDKGEAITDVMVWWPAQRPIDVVQTGEPGAYVPWAREFDKDMVHLWPRLRILIDAAGRDSQRWPRPFPGRTISDHMTTTAFIFFRRKSEHYTLVETVPEGWFYSASAHDQFVLLFMTDPDLHHPVLASAAQQLREAPHTGKRLGQALQSAAQTVTIVAGSSVRNCVATNNWLAVGDARMTLDPLSSSGIVSALHSGRDAAQLIFDIDRGIHDAIDDYHEQTTKLYAQHLRERVLYYSQERRWVNSLFWSRRISPASSIV